MPIAVLYNATEMPFASLAGSTPALPVLPKISIMPMMVPSKPMSGAAAEIVPIAFRYFSRPWPMTLPVSSRASLTTGRGDLMLARPAARICPIGP